MHSLNTNLGSIYNTIIIITYLKFTGPGHEVNFSFGPFTHKVQNCLPTGGKLGETFEIKSLIYIHTRFSTCQQQQVSEVTASTVGCMMDDC